MYIKHLDNIYSKAREFDVFDQCDDGLCLSVALSDRPCTFIIYISLKITVFIYSV